MKVINKKISELVPYENNPRFNENAIDVVANSIKEFGFKVPVVIDINNVIVAGHTRVKACEKLGIKEVPCIVASDLSEEQIKAFRIADNKTSEFSMWDFDSLEKELQEISIDMTQFGFEESEENKESETKNQKKKPQIEFSEVLEEEHNYIVLYFKNDIDWLQAESLFDLKPVMALSTRIDGKVTDGMKRLGVGRVLDGAKALNNILGDKWK